MATNPALVARTTLVAEEPWKAVLRRTLQAVAGALDRLVPPHPLDREVELPLSGSNILRSERAHVPWHLGPTSEFRERAAKAVRMIRMSPHRSESHRWKPTSRSPRQ